jgi:glycosyltransferase involved in cell wall biosynthesis
MNAATPSASVVIRTKNEGAHLGRVLEALAGQDYAPGLEIVIVDSGSTDDTLSIARSHDVCLIEIRAEEFTYGRALNVGSQAARGEFLVNLSGHAIPCHREYLTNLLAPLEDGEVWATYGRDVPHPGCCPSQARDIHAWFPAQGPGHEGFFSNANACLRRIAWEAFPFDESLGWAEDARWAEQVLGRGYRIVYAPEAQVYHSHACSAAVVRDRARREALAMKRIDPARARYNLWRALRHWLGLSLLDYGYALRTAAHPKWWFHVPIYRAYQAWGLYLGSR